MAINWGSVYGSSSGGQMRLGYSFSQSPTSLTPTTSSVVVTLKVYVWSKWSCTDNNNTFSVSGSFTRSANDVSISCSSNSSWSTSNQKLLCTLQKTVSSLTSDTTLTFSANLHGVEAIGTGTNVVLTNKSYTVKARPIAAAHPTITAGEYNFSDISKLYSFSTVTGSGLNWTLSSVSASLQTVNDTDSGLSLGVVNTTMVDSEGYLSFTEAIRDNILTYWQNTSKEITKMKITVITNCPGALEGTVKTQVIYVYPYTIDDSTGNKIPLKIKDLYRVDDTSISVSHDTVNINGTSEKQLLSISMDADKESPFAQAGRWPSNLLSMVFSHLTFSEEVSISNPNLSAPATVVMSPTRTTYSILDITHPIISGESRNYTFTPKQSDTGIFYSGYGRTLNPPTPFLALRNDGGVKKLGINQNNPTETLDIVGNVKVSGNIYGNIIGGIPGEIKAVAFPVLNLTDVDGWLLCNGAAVSRTTYSVLFGLLGTTYGIGDGVNTFNIPDFRGLFLRGLGTNGYDNTAVSAGLGTFQADQNASHTHTYSYPGATNAQELSAGTTASYDSRSGTTSSSGGTEARPNNMAVNYIIKY